MTARAHARASPRENVEFAPRVSPASGGRARRRRRRRRRRLGEGGSIPRDDATNDERESTALAMRTTTTARVPALLHGRTWSSLPVYHLHRADERGVVVVVSERVDQFLAMTRQRTK
jgi:hypothetical protein